MFIIVRSGHGWDVKALDWHPRRGLLASGAKDALIKLWDPRGNTAIATLHGHKGKDARSIQYVHACICEIK